MKAQWRKDEKHIYLPKTAPEFIEIPKFKYVTISGVGNPNKEEFGLKTAALYALAYGIKMLPKKGITPDGYEEYTVYPLEGIWDLSEEGRKKEFFDKEELVYKIMIRQPDFVTEEIVKAVIKQVNEKKPSMLYEQIAFEEIKDGPCVQMMHLGPYDDESRSFDLMKDYCTKHTLKREDLRHREIYLSDPRKVAPEKMKTVLRYFISMI